MQEVVIVLGYGCDLNENMKAYLTSVAEYLETTQNEAIVVTTGGFTNWVSARGMSEARMMSVYLKNLTDKPVHLEERARTTSENLIFTAELLDALEIRPDVITIFGDRVRKAKIVFLAKRMLGKYKSKIWLRDHNFKQSGKEKITQYIIFTPADIVAFYCPVIESIKLYLRGRTIRRT